MDEERKEEVLMKMIEKKESRKEVGGRKRQKETRKGEGGHYEK